MRLVQQVVKSAKITYSDIIWDHCCPEKYNLNSITY
jgi:hypothetical protein